MSATHIAQIFQLEHPKGDLRLALLAIADCANHAGVAEASLRTLAAMTATDKNAAARLISELRKRGYIQILSKAQGSMPTRYQLVLESCCPGTQTAPVPQNTRDTSPEIIRDTNTQKPAPEKSFVPAGIKASREAESKPTANELGTADVLEVLQAAGVTPSPEQPFYWSRAEHIDELREILKKRSCTVAQLCCDLSAALQRGKTLDHPPKSLAAFLPLLERRRA